MSERLVVHITACFIGVKAMCHCEHVATDSLLNSTAGIAEKLAQIGRGEQAYEVQSFAHGFYERRRSTNPLAYTTSLLALSQISLNRLRYEAADALLRQALDGFEEPLSAEGRLVKESCEIVLATIIARWHKGSDETEQMLRQILLRPDCVENEEWMLHTDWPECSQCAAVIVKRRKRLNSFSTAM